MVTLNDYLYSGSTIFRILNNYIRDLRKDAKVNHNEIDLVHSNFLIHIQEMLEHNDFLTAQSQKIREFYRYMAKEYPFLAFTFRGRIKSLIRAEEKFNGYIVEYIYDYYEKYGSYPSVAQLKDRLSCFRDFIAYRIVISLPKCYTDSEEDRKKRELEYLYQIANILPEFLEERGFTAEPAEGIMESTSPLLKEEVHPYYRDYISHNGVNEYQSLHITFYDMAPVGAALLAGVGAGVFKDIYEASDKVDKHVYKVVKSSDKHKDVYEKRYQVYTKLYPQIKELYKIGSDLH